MSIVGFLIQNPIHLLTGIAIGIVTFIVYFIYGLYSSRKRYPPGPFPLPIIGNIHLLRGKKHVHEIFLDLSKKYGPIYTFYFGHTPQVMVADKELSLEVMKKHQFAGRPTLPLLEEFFPKDSIDLALADFNPEWEVLRKVAHSALRKYAVSDTLPRVVSDVVDEVLEHLKSSIRDGKEIDMKHWTFKTIYSILASSAFGQRYTFDDPELLSWIDSMETQQKLNTDIIVVAFVPFLKPFYLKPLNLLRKTVKFQQEFLWKKYEEHISSFDGVTIRDFTDAMLLAKKEAEEENALDAVQYLKPWNINNTILDLFTAGSETSRLTLQWAFLLMATYPEQQRKLRKEIESIIGDKDIPTLEHRSKCHHCVAFIAEVLRFRHIVPFNLPHKSTVDIEIGGHLIREGTSIQPMIVPGLMDETEWGDPKVFRPERFLDENGKLISKPNVFYTPFSAGRRTCPGEKVALADLFFVVARFLQKTKGYVFCLPDGPESVDLYGDPSQTSGWIPVDYKLLLRPSTM